MKTLPVPYASQILNGALSHNNDCGPTCALMLAQAYGLAKEKTVDQVYDQIQTSGDVPLSAGQLRTWLRSVGLESEWEIFDIHLLFDRLVQKKPIIALIHYAPLVDAKLTEKTGFRGAHFVVVTGLDIESVAIHDPYRTNDSGTNQPIPIDTFTKAWQECAEDGNPPFGGLTPRLPIQDLSKPAPAWIDYIVVPGGIYIRTGPSENSPLANPPIAWRGEILHIVEKTVGKTGYAKMANGNYVWSNFLMVTN